MLFFFFKLTKNFLHILIMLVGKFEQWYYIIILILFARLEFVVQIALGGSNNVCAFNKRYFWKIHGLHIWYVLQVCTFLRRSKLKFICIWRDCHFFGSFQYIDWWPLKPSLYFNKFENKVFFGLYFLILRYVMLNKG